MEGRSNRREVHRPTRRSNEARPVRNAAEMVSTSHESPALAPTRPLHNRDIGDVVGRHRTKIRSRQDHSHARWQLHHAFRKKAVLRPSWTNEADWLDVGKRVLQFLLFTGLRLCSIALKTFYMTPRFYVSVYGVPVFKSSYVTNRIQADENLTQPKNIWADCAIYRIHLYPEFAWLMTLWMKEGCLKYVSVNSELL